jgi:hypothetical protein
LNHSTAGQALLLGIWFEINIVDIGEGFACKHGERHAAIRRKEKNHGIEESHQEPQEGQEAGADQAAAKFHKDRIHIQASDVGVMSPDRLTVASR